MKNALIIFLLLAKFSNGQNKKIKSDSITNKKYTGVIEFFCLPPLVQTFGIGITNDLKYEHIISGSTLLCPYYFSAGLKYNLNYSFKKYENRNLYIPFWLGIKRIKWYIFETQNPVFGKEFLSFGSGIGIKLKLNQKNSIRLELGVGSAFNLLRDNYFVNYQNSIIAVNSFEIKGINNRIGVSPSIKLNVRYLVSLKK